MKSELKQRTLQNLADAYSGKQLRVNTEYQRGTKWSLPQKQGLIDSLLRGYQIPLFYVHLEARVNNYTGEVEKIAWLVDGHDRWKLCTGLAQRRDKCLHCISGRRSQSAPPPPGNQGVSSTLRALWQTVGGDQALILRTLSEAGTRFYWRKCIPKCGLLRATRIDVLMLLKKK
jgi:hypothetical protein